MKPIGYIRSPYEEKFAVPRQPGLAPSAIGYCDLIEQAGHPDAVRGLEQFSHIWVLFQFHQTQQQGWQPLVRPPRLGGNKKVGVFASRSTFRPNGIGMSLLQLEHIEQLKVEGKTINRLVVRGLDLIDGTPILDVKPYLPYAESITDAEASYATQKPVKLLTVRWQKKATEKLALYQNTRFAELDLAKLIEEVLQQDPRPAYQADQTNERIYGVKLAGLDVQFGFVEPGFVDVIDVLEILKSSTNNKS